MSYTEIQKKASGAYYYRASSVRTANGFRKSRMYLGKDLKGSELAKKIENADLVLASRVKKKLTEAQALSKIMRTKWDIHHNRSSIVPALTAGSLFDIFSTDLVPLFGESYNQLLMIYSEGKTYAAFPSDKHKLLSQIAIAQLRKNPAIVKEFIKKFRALAVPFVTQLRKNSKHFSQNSTFNEIIRFYNKYYADYAKVCLQGEPFPLVVHDCLLEYLKKVLSLTELSPSERSRILTLLVTPTQPSFVNKEEKDLFGIVQCVEQSSSYKKLFSKNMYSILEELSHHSDLYAKINAHTKKYFWLSYDYFGKSYDVPFFVRRIKEILLAGTQHKDHATELFALRDKQVATLKKLLTQKKISEQDAELFYAAQDCTLLIDYKKEMLSQAHYYINKVLEVAAKKAGIPLDQLVFALKKELPSAITSQTMQKKLQKRSITSAYYFSNAGTHIFLGKDVDSILSSINGDEKSKCKEFSGICASPGTVIGRVKILSSPGETNKITQGDVLVTGMTTPEYISAMKKASAIITDEGGITCHAAIVSRELGIPCIVGTKIATRALKDNDLVELHAVMGVIKILSR